MLAEASSRLQPLRLNTGLGAAQVPRMIQREVTDGQSLRNAISGNSHQKAEGNLHSNVVTGYLGK